MKSFREVAQQELSLSPLMSGRQQISTQDIVNQALTVEAFDFASITDKGETKTFPIIIFKEYPEFYYNGGSLLKKVCIAWAGMYDNDPDAASAALEADGGVTIKLTETRTKSGNNLVLVDIL